MSKILWFFLIIPSLAFAHLKIAIIGDSISCGYGVEKEESFVYLLEKMFEEEDKEVEIWNRSFNGAQTNTGEMIVVDLLTKDRPDIVVINLGINDAGYGVSQADLTKNFDKMVWKLYYSKVKVIIGGIEIKATTPSYASILWAAYNHLREKYKTIPYAFLTSDTLLNKTIGDHIHPNAEGHKIIAQELFKTINSLGS